MNLSQIIERKKEEFDATFISPTSMWATNLTGDKWYHKQDVRLFLEKAIRESVEEALREVRPKGTGKDGDYIDGFIGCLSAYDSRVKEFMK